jgi:SAM-dependent methyltransferase
MGVTIPRPLSTVEVEQLDPYAFFAVLGKRVIHPGGRTATDALIRRAEFAPGQQVLDVGCGVGRTAIALTSYLSPDGGYEGFDIWPEAIDWCRQEITSRFPHFRFTAIDLFNAAYKPRGRISPSRFTFPYSDEEFDLAILYSVFTHMLTADFEHYLMELARVLKKGGRVVATFFLLNERSLQELDSARDAITPEGSQVAWFLLERDFGPYRAGYEIPEWLVAYKEDFVRDAFGEAGFDLEQPVVYGSWVEWACGRASEMGPQDTVIARR